MATEEVVEITNEDLKAIRKARKKENKLKRENFGNIEDPFNYKGPWADYIYEEVTNHSFIVPNKIVSKQNCTIGREVFKSVIASTEEFFQPIACNKLTFPSTKKYTFSEHKDRITSLKFFKNYDLLASSSEDGKLVIYGQKPLIKLIGHSHGLSGFDIGQDQQIIFTYSFDGYAKSWDLNLKKCTHRLNINSPITSNVSSDSIFLGCASGDIFALDTRINSPIFLKNENCPVTSLCTGMNILSAIKGDKSIALIDLRMNRTITAKKGNYISAVSLNDTIIALDGFNIIDLKNELSPYKDYKIHSTTKLFTTPDKSDIFYGTDDGEIIFLNSKEVLKVANKAICEIAISERNWNDIAFTDRVFDLNVWN